MSTSILNDIKKVLGVDTSYTVFDLDIMMHINSVFSILSQLGVGPDNPYMINGSEETWDDFMTPMSDFNTIKSYIYLRVRLLFDPPVMSFLIEAMDKQIRELEWRMNTRREETQWTEPPSRMIIPVTTLP